MCCSTAAAAAAEVEPSKRNGIIGRRHRETSIARSAVWVLYISEVAAANKAEVESCKEGVFRINCECGLFRTPVTSLTWPANTALKDMNEDIGYIGIFFHQKCEKAELIKLNLKSKKKGHTSLK
jgi:hypothetical protein